MRILPEWRSPTHPSPTSSWSSRGSAPRRRRARSDAGLWAAASDRAAEHQARAVAVVHLRQQGDGDVGTEVLAPVVLVGFVRAPLDGGLKVQDHPAVQAIYYPGLPGHAGKYPSEMSGGMPGPLSVTVIIDATTITQSSAVSRNRLRRSLSEGGVSSSDI